MKVSKIVSRRLTRGQPVISVEIIPPRNGTRLSAILEKVEQLRDCNPDFVSITRGAGGSLRGGTVPIAYLIKQRLGIETVAHLTCIDNSVEELENLLMDHHYLEIENILALRGDPPRDASPDYSDHRGLNFHKYALGLVEQINRMNQGKYLARAIDRKKGKVKEGQSYRPGEPTDFCVLVAGHPEGHPECPSQEETLQHLKAKVDTGADLVVTQMVFSGQIYSNFVRKAQKNGITVPIIPGVRPIVKPGQINHIENFFGVKVSNDFKEGLSNLSPADARKKGLEITWRLCEDLLNRGAPGIHFYLMNDVKLGCKIISRINRE